jgi:hypothetical protein
MLGLAMVAAVAAMAFVGAGTASANETKLTWCTNNNALCQGKDVLKLITAKATNPVLLGNLNQECETSTTMTTEESATTTTISGVVDELTFETCKPCTTITTTPPYKSSITGSTMTSSGSATFKNCPFGINCKFGSAKIELTLGKNATGLYDRIIAEKEPLSLEEGSAFFCGSTGEWDATYTLETPLYLVPKRHANP